MQENMLPSGLGYSEYTQNKQYQTQDINKIRPHALRRASSSLSMSSMRSLKSVKEQPELDPARMQADKSPGSRYSSSDPVFSFKEPIYEQIPHLVRTRHCSSNYPLSNRRPKVPDRPATLERTKIEPQPVKLGAQRLVQAVELDFVEQSIPPPDPIYKYSSSDENTAEPNFTKLRKKKPRNALRLERPKMESFNPLHTSERLDSRSSRTRKAVSSSETLHTLPTFNSSESSPNSPPPLSPRKGARDMSASLSPRKGAGDLDEVLMNLQAKTDCLDKLYRDLEEDTRTNTRDIGNLQENIVKVASAKDMHNSINRMGGQASSLMAELQSTQRNVVKCLSEAEQARRDFDVLKEKTEAILMLLQQGLSLGDMSGLSLSSRLIINPQTDEQNNQKRDRSM